MLNFLKVSCFPFPSHLLPYLYVYVDLWYSSLPTLNLSGGDQPILRDCLFVVVAGLSTETARDFIEQEDAVRVQQVSETN